VGTIFMIGDTKNLLPLSKQLIFNPFRGYPDSRKNIRDPRLKESICEFAKIDGAFILKGDGVVRSAGRLLHIPARSKVQIAEGLGSRHNAAAYITKKTDSIAVVVSESTGVVSVFIKGRIIFHLEPSAEEYALN
jgi:DNA integrity scanning protein DisA with diadenylate cyclase activity